MERYIVCIDDRYTEICGNCDQCLHFADIFRINPNTSWVISNNGKLSACDFCAVKPANGITVSEILSSVRKNQGCQWSENPLLLNGTFFAQIPRDITNHIMYYLDYHQHIAPTDECLSKNKMYNELIEYYLMESYLHSINDVIFRDYIFILKELPVVITTEYRIYGAVRFTLKVNYILIIRCTRNGTFQYYLYEILDSNDTYNSETVKIEEISCLKLINNSFIPSIKLTSLNVNEYRYMCSLDGNPLWINTSNLKLLIAHSTLNNYYTIDYSGILYVAYARRNILYFDHEGGLVRTTSDITLTGIYGKYFISAKNKIFEVYLVGKDHDRLLYRFCSESGYTIIPGDKLIIVSDNIIVVICDNGHIKKYAFSADPNLITKLYLCARDGKLDQLLSRTVFGKYIPDCDEIIDYVEDDSLIGSGDDDAEVSAIGVSAKVV